VASVWWASKGVPLCEMYNSTGHVNPDSRLGCMRAITPLVLFEQAASPENSCVRRRRQRHSPTPAWQHARPHSGSSAARWRVQRHCLDGVLAWRQVVQWSKCGCWFHWPSRWWALKLGKDVRVSPMMDGQRQDVMRRLVRLDERFEACVGSGCLVSCSEKAQEASLLWLCGLLINRISFESMFVKM
jgi:hypothetical protein